MASRRTSPYVLGVRYGLGREQPYHVDLSDDGWFMETLSHQRNRFTEDMAGWGDEFATPESCGQSADVAHDGVTKVFLWQGQRLLVRFIDVWYPEPQRDPARDICFSLVTDLRLGSGSCVDADCGRFEQYGFGQTFTAPEVGWYYVICDYAEAPSSWSVFANLEYHRDTPYIPPPSPPTNDGPTGAPVIPPGDSIFYGDLTYATDQVDPGPDGCLDYADLHLTGGDVVYQVDLAAGERLVSLLLSDGDWEAALYLVSDPVDAFGRCVAAGVTTDLGVELDFTAFDAQTVWLICDSWGVGAKTFRLVESDRLGHRRGS